MNNTPYQKERISNFVTLFIKAKTNPFNASIENMYNWRIEEDNSTESRWIFSADFRIKLDNEEYIDRLCICTIVKAGRDEYIIEKSGITVTTIGRAFEISLSIFERIKGEIGL